MNILSVPSLAAVAALALTVGCGAPRPTEPLDVRQRFEARDLPAVDVRLRLQPEHRGAQQRYVRAAMAVLENHGRWLGPFPQSSLTIVDPGRLDALDAAASSAVVLAPTPWWTTAAAMQPELATARAVSRRFWTTMVDASALPPWFVDGLSEFASRRVVTALFEQENLPPGYALREERFFGGFVPLRSRIRFLPESGGPLLSAYWRQPRVSPASAQTSRSDREALAAKTVLALGTLERWVGSPAFDQLMTVFVRQFRSGRPTIDDFARTASQVTGQDLSWFFAEVFASSRVFDYGLAALTSERGADGAFDTIAVIRRFGDAQFTGTSAPPIGGFESGRGIVVRVSFEDGQRRTDYWDGRSRERVFRYRSPARAAAAAVDPADVLLLDVSQANNSITLAPRGGAVATGWALRWMSWLEHALLTYGALV